MLLQGGSEAKHLMKNVLRTLCKTVVGKHSLFANDCFLCSYMVSGPDALGAFSEWLLPWWL